MELYKTGQVKYGDNGDCRKNGMGLNFKIYPEFAYLSFFGDVVDQYLSEVVSAPPVLLSERAVTGIGKAFWETLHSIAGDTLEELRLKIIVRDNPFAAYDKNLCTKQQKEEAALVLKTQLERKEQELSEELYHVIRSRFRLLVNAFSTMLRNIASCKNEISKTLFDGKTFTRIEHIEATVGDYHNFACATAIIETDCGKMLYKPRNCLTDVRTDTFVNKYFPDSVVIPKCYTDGATFGVCEYLQSMPAQGEDEAKKWFYALGELTVLVQILGSYDMHYENIIAVKGLPALIDLETILRPRPGFDHEPDSSRKQKPAFMDALQYSLWISALLPRNMKDMEFSVLLRTGDACPAPVVNGIPVTVCDYSESYYSGLENAYRRCLKKKNELTKDVWELFSEVPVRVMIRNTQVYADLMQRLYKARVLSDEESHRRFAGELKEALLDGWMEEPYDGICLSETNAILRGDIPYFYAPGCSCDIYDAEGKVGRALRESGLDGSLKRIRHMSEQELMFEKKLIQESLESRLEVTRQNDRHSSGTKKPGMPERSAQVLSPDLAVQEAETILKTVYRRMIQSPDGSCGWIECNGENGAPEIMSGGMFTGMIGIGVFAAAAACTVKSDEVQEAAWRCQETAVNDLQNALEGFHDLKHFDAKTILCDKLGEASGMAGILRCLALMNQYSGCNRYAAQMDSGMDLLKQLDVSAVTEADRLGGLAGLIAVLCGFPEYYQKEQGKDLIAAFADRLLELKNYEADGYKLWKTVSRRHMISGAGHGMAGIAQALYAAGSLLQNEDYFAAALDAIRYEEQVYSKKLGTWPDNRIWPAQSYMNGYCSGAPGIGMMIQRIRQCLTEGRDPASDRLPESCESCAVLAEQAIDRLPLLYRDHLCCGNCAIAEYHLSLGEWEKAGKVLNSMYLRKETKKAYTIMPYGYHNTPRLSLLYGITGIGYEMLRYAFPDMIQSLF